VDSVVLVNPSLPNASFTSTSGCFGTPATFNGSGSTAGTGDVITGYTWNFGDAGSGSNSSTIVNPTHVYSAPCTFNVTLAIVTQKGCIDTAYGTVTVDPIPQPNFGPPAQGCMPVCVTLADSSTIDSCGSIAKWTWDFGDGQTASGNISSVNHCYPQPGSYSVKLTVESNKGCVNDTTRTNLINVYPFPSAEFLVSPTSTEILFPTISFYDQSTGSPVRWRWDFGITTSDSDTSVLQTPPPINYPDTGTYNICLEIWNQWNCYSNICHPVVIKPIWTFYIPNAFTPNGDGDNDGFIGKGYNIIEHQMWVFDRWGDLVYTTGKTRDPASGIPWDGKANGGADLAQEDVYVWVVKLVDVFGKKHRYVGSVTLVR
jgi:gliding motility-associated-like protein